MHVRLPRTFGGRHRRRWGAAHQGAAAIPDGRGAEPTPTAEGRTPAKVDSFTHPDLARTLRLIGERGRDAFYTGEIADKIDAFMRANGGFLRKTDFEKHTPPWVEQISVNYRGYDVFELPPQVHVWHPAQLCTLDEGPDMCARGTQSTPPQPRNARPTKHT